MAVVELMLFGLYAVASVVAMAAFNFSLSLVVLGSVLFVGVQYKIGKWAAIRECLIVIYTPSLSYL
jgi:heat shock protein HtpX